MSLVMRKFAQLCLDCDVIFGNAFNNITVCPRCGSSAFAPVSQFIKKADPAVKKVDTETCEVKIKRIREA